MNSDQTLAVQYGITKPNESWEEIDRPVGRQPLPDWLRGLRIYWMEEFCNSPHIVLKVRGDVRHWENQVWRIREGGFFTEHPDGRRWAVGANPSSLAIRAHSKIDGQEVWGWATARSEGCGGWKMPIKLVDGRDVIVWGPWFGSPDIGYQEASYKDAARFKWHRRWSPNFWDSGCATAGMWITNELMIRALCTFAPHLRLAMVREYGMERIEPMKPEWDTPKAWQPGGRHATNFQPQPR